MVKREYNGNDNRNARINISYTDKKPKVSFSYPVPKRHKPVQGSMFIYIVMGWMLIWFIGYSTYGHSNSLDESLYGKTHLQEFTECASNYSQYTLSNYSYVRNDLCYQYMPNSVLIKNSLIDILIIMGTMLIPPILIYHPWRKKWEKLYPDFQAWLSLKKRRVFKPKDIQVKDNQIFIELPVFNNIICDFKATKDFSKYLREFDIREYNFHYLVKKRIKIGKKYKRIRKYNQGIWYARWYFTTKPQKGELKVIFK